MREAGVSGRHEMSVIWSEASHPQIEDQSKGVIPGPQAKPRCSSDPTHHRNCAHARYAAAYAAKPSTETCTHPPKSHNLSITCAWCAPFTQSAGFWALWPVKSALCAHPTLSRPPQAQCTGTPHSTRCPRASP